MRTIAFATLALLAASCGSNAPPCTTCLNVAGTYEVTIDPRSADSSTCDMLLINGGTWVMELYQKGSELDMPTFFETGIKGTLMEDESARFGPLKTRIGNTAPAVYANTTLSGAFTGEEATRRFSGSLVFSAMLENRTCALSTPIRMVKQTTAP